MSNPNNNPYSRFAMIGIAALFIATLGFAQDTSSDQAEAPAEAAAPGFAKLETTVGDIYLRLRADKAPLSVENFINYAQDGFYDGTIFHRVVADFVIQGGGFTPDLEKKPTQAPIRNEADNMLANKRGAVSMARTMDPHSATSQFYINVQDNMALDHAGKNSPNAWGYAVFAEVVDGMDVVDAMRMVPVGAAGPMPSNVPRTPLVISKVTLLEALPTTETNQVGGGSTESTDENAGKSEQAAAKEAEQDA